MITIDNPNPRDHLRTEWLLTNGLGGYAMGTVLGINTRRYHGLLVAATNPHGGRIVALHSMIEQLIIPRDDGTEEIIDLSTQMFVRSDGEPMVHPHGWKWLRSFAWDCRTAIWTYQIEDIIVRKHILPNRNHCENAVRLMYDLNLVDGGAVTWCELRVRPILAMRDAHALGPGSTDEPLVHHNRTTTTIAIGRHAISFEPSDLFHDSPQSWKRFAYVEDRDRGLEWIENLISPGFFSTSEHERERAGICIDCKIPNEPQISEHVLAAESSADQFLAWGCEARKPARVSILAGYPWFAEWGRDAMISLPGLLLCTKRFDEAKSLLLRFASHLRNGLIPNHFDDATGEARYNTVDASLWFIHAVREYSLATQKVERELLSACCEIIRAYRAGTEFNIGMDSSDGLISAGNERTQLTWMDAARDGVIFTPRHGKPVEVNALWYNALHCLAEMTDDASEARELLDLASRVRESFTRAFWWKEKECLHDVLTPQSPRLAIRGCLHEDAQWTPDTKLRPNQVLAVSLPFSPLAEEQQRGVVNIVRERFLTPYGLRTLDRDDPDYQGRFEGDLFARDRAYHNGTAWPWLLGPYCEALLRINDFSDESKCEVRAVLQPLLDELTRTTGPGCLGQLAEVYDGDGPQRPAGCVAQAWSVAEVMRILALIDER